MLFDRSIRTADFELYCYCLDKMTNIFFAVNHQNYARWLSWYLNTLFNVDITHPGLKDSFNQGSYGCKRTAKPFSRIPIDLTLEQTINADAGRKLSGISHITNSIRARMRWSINHGLRCEMISKVMEDCGISTAQDITNDLLRHNITKSAEHAENFILSFNERINPFSVAITKDALLNISTGRSVPDEVENFLLNIEVIGENMKKQLIEQCKEDIDSFQKYSIKRNKILNFASTKKKVKIHCTGKVQEVLVQRDLFGRLLGISWGSGERINLQKV